MPGSQFSFWAVWPCDPRASRPQIEIGATPSCSVTLPPLECAGPRSPSRFECCVFCFLVFSPHSNSAIKSKVLRYSNRNCPFCTCSRLGRIGAPASPAPAVPRKAQPPCSRDPVAARRGRFSLACGLRSDAPRRDSCIARGEHRAFAEKSWKICGGWPDDPSKLGPAIIFLPK